MSYLYTRLFTYLVCECMCVRGERGRVIYVCVCHDTWVVELKGDPMGFDCKPHGVQGSSLGHWAEQHEL